MNATTTTTRQDRLVNEATAFFTWESMLKLEPAS